MKLDILAFAAHPDDTELSCSGTLAMQISKGSKVGVVDLTRGELSTRGTPDLRASEAQDSSEFLGLAVRENLEMEDGFFKNERTEQLKVVQAIRKYQPDIVLANAITDRHPDHGRAAELVKSAWFLAGLKKIVTENDGETQASWRPRVLYHYIQSWYVQPDFVIDISEFWDKKIEAISKFKTQFFDADSSEPETYISKKGFLDATEARAVEFGQSIDAKYGEGFTVNRNIGVSDLTTLL